MCIVSMLEGSEHYILESRGSYDISLWLTHVIFQFLLAYANVIGLRCIGLQCLRCIGVFPGIQRRAHSFNARVWHFSRVRLSRMPIVLVVLRRTKATSQQKSQMRADHVG